jgi:hypothetical protein
MNNFDEDEHAAPSNGFGSLDELIAAATQLQAENAVLKNRVAEFEANVEAAVESRVKLVEGELRAEFSKRVESAADLKAIEIMGAVGQPAPVKASFVQPNGTGTAQTSASVTGLARVTNFFRNRNNS